MTVTADQIEFYRTHGYLTVENVFPMARIEEARRVVDAYVERSRAVTASDEVYDLEPDHTPERPKLRRLKRPDQLSPIFAEFIRSDAVLDILTTLIGQGVRFLGSKINVKAADGGTPIEWHQDFAFFPHTNDAVLAVGVYFDDATVDNGCLLVVPGVHNGPVLDHHKDGCFVGAIVDSARVLDLDRAVPIQVRAGGISIHHGHTPHASAPNRSSRPRRLLLHDLAGVDAWPLSGVSDLDAFNRRILRGAPTLTPRLADVSVRIPLPRLPRASTIFEMQEASRERAFGKR